MVFGSYLWDGNGLFPETLETFHMYASDFEIKMVSIDHSLLSWQACFQRLFRRIAIKSA